MLVCVGGGGGTVSGWRKTVTHRLCPVRKEVRRNARALFCAGGVRLTPAPAGGAIALYVSEGSPGGRAAGPASPERIAFYDSIFPSDILLRGAKLLRILFMKYVSAPAIF